jgi:hypothetical protein
MSPSAPSLSRGGSAGQVSERGNEGVQAHRALIFRHRRPMALLRERRGMPRPLGATGVLPGVWRARLATLPAWAPLRAPSFLRSPRGHPVTTRDPLPWLIQVHSPLDPEFWLRFCSGAYLGATTLFCCLYCWYSPALASVRAVQSCSGTLFFAVQSCSGTFPCRRILIGHLCVRYTPAVEPVSSPPSLLGCQLSSEGFCIFKS